ncbi:MAG: sigma-70 family RNA polymerase sigma factor [Phycisphaerae bacterium]|nr:sigma-70 family RNA polymerase sigma factor [Phycisphaerae bacterium]
MEFASHEDTDDGRLLMRMRQGDRHALTEFLGRYRDELLGWTEDRLNKQRPGGFEAEDILSTVARRFLGVLGARRFRASNLLEARGFLYAIARNALSKAMRRERAAGTAASDAHQQGSGDSGPGHSDADGFAGVHGLSSAAESRLLKLVSNLDVESHAIVMGKLDGRSSAQIAASIGCSANAVNHRWMTMRRELRDALAD